MKKILILLLFVTSSLFSQNNDKVTLYDKDYNKLKDTTTNEVMNVVDSLYNVNNDYYNAFYLINSKDTLFMRRKQTHIKTYKLQDGNRI